MIFEHRAELTLDTGVDAYDQYMNHELLSIDLDNLVGSPDCGT